MPTIIPVLHNPSAFDTGQFASRFLVDAEEMVPIVAYLRTDDEGESSYITWKSLKKGNSGLEDLDSRAMKDLTHRADRPGWDSMTIPFRGKDVTIMQRLGDFYTASDILDPEILEIVHNYFQSKVVFVGIPHACCMVASDDPDYVLAHFFAAYDEATAEGVQFFDCVYRVEDETLTELIPAKPVPTGPTMRSVNGVDILWFTMPFRGDYNLLRSHIISDAQAFIPTYLNTPGFSGRVVFEIPKSAPKFNLGQCQDLSQVEHELNAMASGHGWLMPSGAPAAIRIFYEQRKKPKRGLSMKAMGMFKGNLDS